MGKDDYTMDRAVALIVADLSPIPSTPYSLPAQQVVFSERRATSKTIVQPGVAQKEIKQTKKKKQ